MPFGTVKDQVTRRKQMQAGAAFPRVWLEGEAVVPYGAATYTPPMPLQDRLNEDDPPADAIDALPVVGRATTQLERSFGPSCLLSLVIVLLLMMVLKRYLAVSWPMLGCLVFFTWIGVLILLVRWRPDRVIDEDA